VLFHGWIPFHFAGSSSLVGRYSAFTYQCGIRGGETDREMKDFFFFRGGAEAGRRNASL
jgi:hypothetical protein